MIKNEKNITLCSALLCSIDVLGCPCCGYGSLNKGNGGEGGGGKQKDDVELKDKAEWEFKQDPSRNIYLRKLLSGVCKNRGTVPVVPERHADVGVCMNGIDKVKHFVAVDEKSSLQGFYENCNDSYFTGMTLKSLTFFIAGKKNLKYPGGVFLGEETLKAISDIYIDSEDGFLYMSYIAEELPH
ncbi:MAG: hypothetical protein II393_03080 [Cytophagales bacterium]|nr:hypothetical protein [Cytophagales bacterium]